MTVEVTPEEVEKDKERQWEIARQSLVYNEELDKLHEAWSKTSYLDGISDRWQRRVLAVILDNQRLFMQEDFHEDLREHALSLIQKVFSKFIGWDLISVQPMLGPKSSNFYLNFQYSSPEEISLVINKSECTAGTRRLKIPLIEHETFRSSNWVDELATVIRKEITAEIFDDLKNNVGTSDVWKFSDAEGMDKFESLYIKLMEIHNTIHKKTLQGGFTWMVMGKEVADIFNSASSINLDNFEELTEPTYIGRVHGRWNVYVDPDMGYEILMGYRGPSHMASGYFYNPYVFFTPTPVTLSQDEFKPLRGVLTRYSKKLILSGSKFYAKLKIDFGS